MKKLTTGDTYTETVRFTQENVNRFAEISGDNNPIHIDTEYAATTPFGRPIVHGFLAGAVFSKVFGTTWPGEGTIYMYQSMSFRAPVFVGRDYVARFEIAEVNADKHRGTVRCTLEDADDGRVVIEGEAKLMNVKKF